LGVPLHELLGWQGPMTHRQFAAWQEWLLLEANRPGRLEHYLMRVGLEIRRVIGLFTKDPGPMTLDAFRVPFERAAPPKPETAAQKGARSKATWRGIFAGLSRKGR
jgi:hypothetical protein